MDFADRLLSLRKKLNLTQLQLAEAIGIPRTQLANYEQRKNYPHFDTLLRLADHLRVSLDYLACRDEYTVTSFMSQSFPDAEKTTIEQIVKRLDEERYLFKIPKLDLDRHVIVPHETKWVYLPHASDYNNVGYIHTRGMSVSQLDKFQDALLVIGDEFLEYETKEPKYVLMCLVDGSYHVSVELKGHGRQYISTYDFVLRPDNPKVARAAWRILKVEHLFV